MTREGIIESERLVCLMIDECAALDRELTRETNANRGRCTPGNEDNWVTLGLNMLDLWKKMEPLAMRIARATPDATEDKRPARGA